ncbi:hypothetical protein [Aquipuribacter nitratireducens]|uniref:Uncharacterized protein n=1 Tax=Aquipuribacter nitratireducens TaxID=650104 RepID=A0ABW0GQP4_9MICO
MSDVAADGLRAAVAGHGLAELCWSEGGRPRAEVVVPLWHDGTPWIALTYAALGTALAAAAASGVVLSLSHARTAAQDPPALAVPCTVDLVADPAGERFLDALLGQELRKHPPSRALADSALLRREHWWFVPRLLLRLHPTGTPGARPLTPVPADGPGALLVAVDASGRVVVRVPDGVGPVGVPDGPALLVRHAASADLERRAETRLPAEVRDGVVEPAAGTVASPPLPPVPSLLGRWRRQRALERACVDGLRRAGLH